MIDSSAPRLAPWQAEPRQLWSLLFMLHHYAKNFNAVTQNLERAKGMMLAHSGIADGRPEVFFHLAHTYNELLELPVSKTLVTQARRVMETPDEIDIRVFYAMVSELQQNIGEELGAQVFFCVPEKDAPLVNDQRAWWGEDVVRAYPDARLDMRDCCYCLAFNLWTAAIYHAMCVVQYGLHKLCDDLGVTFKKEFDALQWNDILTGIDTRLKQMRADPQTPELTARIHLGAKASSHFFSIREAWRNYVMHGKEHYDPDEAASVVHAVRSIMRALA